MDEENTQNLVMCLRSTDQRPVEPSKIANKAKSLGTVKEAS